MILVSTVWVRYGGLFSPLLVKEAAPCIIWSPKSVLIHNASLETGTPLLEMSHSFIHSFFCPFSLSLHPSRLFSSLIHSPKNPFSMDCHVPGIVPAAEHTEMLATPFQIPALQRVRPACTHNHNRKCSLSSYTGYKSKK